MRNLEESCLRTTGFLVVRVHGAERWRSWGTKLDIRSRFRGEQCDGIGVHRVFDRGELTPDFAACSAVALWRRDDVAHIAE